MDGHHRTPNQPSHPDEIIRVAFGVHWLWFHWVRMRMLSKGERRVISTVLRLGALAVILRAFTADAGLIYQTDFEGFTAGTNRWAGTDGWLSNGNTAGAHGIDQDVIPGGGLGKTAYLGFYQPTATQVLVSRSIPYDSTATGVPVIEFKIALGIQDSTNNRRDNFYVYFYNSTGSPLAAIGFINSNNQGVTRYDGAATTTTAASFLHGELQLLSGSINLMTNRWSAELDGVPIFQDAVFNANGRTRVFGSLAFMWQITGGFTANFGNNWMLISDIEIRSIPEGSLPFRLDSFSRGPTGTCTLAWTGQPGFSYQVDWSPDLRSWYSDLPGSLFASRTTTSTLQFSHTPPVGVERRFFRVERTESP